MGLFSALMEVGACHQLGSGVTGLLHVSSCVAATVVASDA